MSVPFLITFPEELPVSAQRDLIAQAILEQQVVIICGETGSGKTTQLPKICLELGRGLHAGGRGMIGHTQPRRIAASSVAKRIAQELQTPLGDVVGFKVRFHDTLSKGASIKLMTDGILLAETQSDPLLRAYDTLIIDEAHERSLNIDFLLGYLKQLLPKRPDLKLIITSATIDADRFAKHFGSDQKPAPVIEVSGRLYPVEVRYRPIQEDAEDKERNYIDAVVDAIDELFRESPGDVLVFLPGEREIRETAEALRKHHRAHTEILTLFARLSAQEQEAVFRLSNARRIVLATNVAETSLTVPGIRYVVDTGLARVKRYSYRTKVEQLHVESIAQSAAKQRAGRCGRVSNGICIRLYDEQDFLARPVFTDPEILRSSLASVILRMQALGLPAVESFPFVDAPLPRAIADGYQLLSELGAVDEAQQLTPLGRQLARLPLDPKVGRMILAAKDQAALREVLIIASALSVQDPRDRPLEWQEAADQAHRKFIDEKSEFLTWLKLWQWFEEALAHKKSNRQLAQHCRESFISQRRMREWRDVHAQLLMVVREQSWRLNESAPTYEQIHQSLLTGFLGNIAYKSEEAGQYLGARGIKCFIWPGSPLAKKAGRWIVAAELVETSRLFARCIARIEPEWLELLATHLIKKTLSDPHWEKKAGQVVAFERGTLYGLTIYAQRRVHFGPRDPETARDIFIRSALVNAEFETKLPFFLHNQKLIEDIQQLEHQSRRQDVLVDDELIYAFYDQLIPKDVYQGATLEHWVREKSKEQPKLLYLSRDDLMRHEAAGITTDYFPKLYKQGSLELKLDYHFEPGAARDGVTMTVPLFALNQVDMVRCEWLVPGMLKEKVQCLLKSLPQKLRRVCVPLPDYIAGFLDRKIFAQGALLDVLIADIREQTRTVVQISDFRLEALPAHLMMNFKVVDEHGRQLAMGRQLAQLRAEFGGQAQQSFQKIALPKTLQLPQQEFTDWTFGVLPELLEIEQLVGYPGLVDQKTHVSLNVFDDPLQARQKHRYGLRRLFALQLRDQIKFLEKNISGFHQMAMQFMSLGSQEDLREQLIGSVIERACMQGAWPDNAQNFSQKKEEGRSRLSLIANEMARVLADILSEYHVLQKKLAQAKTAPRSHADMQQQLQALVHKNFIGEVAYERWLHFPRYLKSLSLRIDKLKANPARDSSLYAELQPLLQKYQQALSQQRGQENEKLNDFRWLLEELRVALFTQELRTPMPMSIKRMYKVWESYAL